MTVEEPKLTLYVRDYCMFCHRVTRTIGTIGLDVDVRNIWQDKGAAQDLLEGTGRHTVPVLRIRNGDGSLSWMPESRDITRYLTALTPAEGRPA